MHTAVLRTADSADGLNRHHRLKPMDIIFAVNDMVTDALHHAQMIERVESEVTLVSV